MAQQNYIKHLREREDLAINNIAKEMDINWRTAKKYADKDNWNTVLKERKKHYPILGDYLDIIDTWLEEDYRRHKKQRHTQIRIYQRLVDECGFTGGQRTVTAYVALKRKALTAATNKFIDLQHPGGEAQIDYGTAEVSHNQKIIQVKYLVMSFPYSNAAYIWFLPSENIECFLTGLQQLIQLAGGVPRKIWFDNLSAAVVKIENYRDRKTTEKFAQFALHYGFQYEFCNVGKGHEKGNVENKVGCTRRNWMVPLPTLITWKDINTQIHKKPKAVTYAWIYSQLHPSVQNYVNISDLNRRKSRIGWLIKWIDGGYTVNQISQAIDRTSLYQLDQEGVLYHTLYQISHPVSTMEALEEYYTPTILKNYDPDLEAYDRLSKEGVTL